VSRTTVSFVLNDRPGVQISPETRARVLAAARELGYRPHPGARHLAGGGTRLIALMLHQEPAQMASDPFLVETVRGLTGSLSTFGYRIVLEGLASNRGAVGDLIRSQHFDAAVLTGPRFDDADLDRLAADGYHIVILGSMPDLAVTTVDIDNVAAAKSAVEHLIGLGRKRIACVTNAPTDYPMARQRRDGYRAALLEAGISLDDRLEASAAFDAASGHRAIDTILDRGVAIDAVFATSDVVAVGVIGGLAARALRVPQDIAVVGFDDIPIAAYLDPPLTTIRVPAFELGLSAGRILVDLLADREVPRRTILPTALVVRGSSRADGRSSPGGPAP